jgi:hypothetical protein
MQVIAHSIPYKIGKFQNSMRVQQHEQIYVKSYARHHFDPYFGPLIYIDAESRFKMAARVLQCKFHMLPDVYEDKNIPRISKVWRNSKKCYIF